MPDQYIKRVADDYAEAFAGQLPRGAAWPRDPDEPLMLLVAGLAGIWGDVAQRSDDLFTRESDPRYAVEMLTDWERAFGLPDPCVPVILSLPERQQALVNKMTTEGGQSRAYFIGVAAALGYSITITEFVPFQFGLSSFGGSHGRIAPPSVRFYWRVAIAGPRLQRFQFGASSCGRDSFLAIRRAEDLECVFTRWQPAQGQVLFDYLGV